MCLLLCLHVSDRWVYRVSRVGGGGEEAGCTRLSPTVQDPFDPKTQARHNRARALSPSPRSSNWSKSWTSSHSPRTANHQTGHNRHGVRVCVCMHAFVRGGRTRRRHRRRRGRRVGGGWGLINDATYGVVTQTDTDRFSRQPLLAIPPLRLLLLGVGWWLC